MPRLLRGQRAASVEARAKALDAGVRMRIDELTRVLSQKAPDAIRLHPFTTLERLAQWSVPARGILPMSPNTLRRRVDDQYPGGMPALRAALQRVRALRHHARDRAHAQYAERRALRRENEALINAMAHWSERYYDLVKRLRHLAETHRPARRALETHQDRYRPSTSLTVVR